MSTVPDTRQSLPSSVKLRYALQATSAGMWARSITVAALLLLLIGHAHLQSTEVITPVPQPVVVQVLPRYVEVFANLTPHPTQGLRFACTVQTSPVAPGVFVETPTFAVCCHPMSHSARMPRNSVLQ